MDYEDSACSLLEFILLSESAEPKDLPLSLLKSITNNFSDDQQIGRGGFATVYKGILENGIIIAVKKLSQVVDIDENFVQEVSNLMRVKHKNIVRFLGYCADTQGKVEKYQGKVVIADVRERLLCFEFLPNGGLDGYISDASHGLEWRTRYQIIKGICEGLDYLHRKKMVHLDLKPANILLNYDMVPKIADFGLSRCFDEKESWITSKLVGSLGYFAPEFFSGAITVKSDIYSLGTVIIEILTGQRGDPSIENVLDSWRNRFQQTQGDQNHLEQIRVCIGIGMKCIEPNPAKRPTIQRIIEALNEMESRYGFDGRSLSQELYGYRVYQSIPRFQYERLGSDPILGGVAVSSDDDDDDVEYSTRDSTPEVDENEVDKKAEEFIARFREQIRRQRIESIKMSAGPRGVKHDGK